MQLDDSRPAAISPQQQLAKTPARLSPRFSWFLSTFFWGSLLTCGLALLTQHVITASQGPTDFCQEYAAVQRLIQGVPIYTPFHCWAGFVTIPTPFELPAHPPTSVLLFLPLGLLPRLPASLLWGLCSLAAYFITGAWLLRALGWWSLRGLALFVVGSVLWEPVTVSETVQNLWEVLTLLIVGAWLLERQGRVGWSGWLLGLAGLIKLWPAGILAGALLQKRKRLALVGLLTLALGTVFSLFIIGPADYANYLGPVQTIEEYWIPSGANVSLVSAVVRPLVGYHDSFFLIPPVARGIPLATAVLLGEFVAALLVTAALALIWRCSRVADDEAIALLSQGFLVTVLLLAFPLSWRWGLITLLFPMTTTLLALRQLPKLPRRTLLLVWIGLAPLLLRQSWIIAVANLLLQQSVWLELLWFSVPTVGLLVFAAMQAHLLGRAVVARRPQKQGE